MAGMSMNTMYGNGPFGTPPADDMEMGAQAINGVGASPAVFWAVLVALLVLARVVWEMAEEK